MPGQKRKILQLFKDHPGQRFSLADIAIHMDVTPSSCTGAFKLLKNEGRLVYVGRFPGGSHGIRIQYFRLDVPPLPETGNLYDE